jgi:hypothetical protein
MRFLIRVALLALAAFGAKTLYDRFRPVVEGTTSSSGGTAVFEPAKSAFRDVAEHAKSAASEVAEHAKSATNEAVSQTRDQLSTESGGGSSTTPSPTPPGSALS